MTAPVFYTQPDTTGETLRVAPALASWDKAGSPGQLRLAAFIDHAHAVVARRVGSVPNPLVFRLDIGLPGPTPLITSHDLDNYLFPLIPKLTERTGRSFASVWATKQRASSSTITIGPATRCGDPGGVHSYDVRTTASASTTAFKEQIRDQITTTTPLPGDAVALQLTFSVGPRRAWPNLWKASIDALGAILGYEHGATEWNPRDGRITNLGLHCNVNPALANSVEIAVRASPARRPTGGV